jgi:hypothetical protein
MLALLIQLTLITVHGLDKQPVEINPHGIVAMRGPREAGEAKHLGPGAQCVIYTSDGKFIAVIETCEQVRKLVEDGKNENRH